MEENVFAEELAEAIRGEEEAARFYAEAAAKTSDPSGAAMFRELAAFERHHREHLEALRGSLARQGGWVAYPPREFPAVPPEGGKAPRLPEGERADAAFALRTALAAEERAEARYRELAGKAPSGEGRKMFHRLAEEEAMHRRLLDDQLFALSNRGVWLWGD